MKAQDGEMGRRKGWISFANNLQTAVPGTSMGFAVCPGRCAQESDHRELKEE